MYSSSDSPYRIIFNFYFSSANVRLILNAIAFMIIKPFVDDVSCLPVPVWNGWFIGLPRRTDWFVLTPPDGDWSRIRATGPVYPDPITTRGYLYPSNISFEDWWTGVIIVTGVGWWVRKSAQIDLRYAYLFSCMNGLASLANCMWLLREWVSLPR